MTRWSDIFRAAGDAIQAHRLRSMLTALGILIGIASVVLTVGLGLGAQRQVQDQIASLGSNLLIVSPGSSTDEDGVRGGFGSGTSLTTADAVALSDSTAAPDVQTVVPVSTTSVSATTASTNWTTTLTGTTAEWAEVRNRDVSSGRFFTQNEADNGANVTILGAETASELFETGNAVGQTLSIGGRQITVVGVLESTGASGDEASANDVAVVPLSVAQAVTGATTTAVSTIYVQATSEDTVVAAYQEVEALLTTLHQVSIDEADFTIATQGSLLETANATNRTMTVLLAGIAAISLLVGGIGVMNVMLVSVTERIREIGLRKALGATPNTIRRQFLVEAGMLGLLGGLAGTLLGVFGALILPSLIDQPVAISIEAIAIALLVSIGLGIGFGVHPASRAANLLPIEALRSE